MSGIAPKQNAFKFKIAAHKQKFIVKKKMDPSWSTGPCVEANLSTIVNPALYDWNNLIPLRYKST
jgi:hypothetical protein